MSENNNKRLIIILSIILGLVIAVGIFLVLIVARISNEMHSEPVESTEPDHIFDSQTIEPDTQKEETVEDAESADAGTTAELSDKEEQSDESEDKELVIEYDINGYMFTLLASIVVDEIEFGDDALVPGQLDADWIQVFKLIDISDRICGVGDQIALNKEYNMDDGITRFYYDIESLENLAYWLTGEHMTLGSLEEAKNYLCNGNTCLESDVEIKDNYLIVKEGEAGYMGPDITTIGTNYLGDDRWEVYGHIFDTDFDTKWYVTLYATVIVDENSIFDGFRLEDVRWDTEKHPEYFDDWQVAYLDFLDKYHEESTTESQMDDEYFNLIYLDDDKIPELVLEKQGFYVSVYKYDGREVKEIFSGNYGAFGINSYDYVPKEGMVVWTDIDYAGLEFHVCAIKLNSNDEFEEYLDKSIGSRYYIDANKDGMYDENEEISEDEEFYFFDNEEVSYDEYEAYCEEKLGDLDVKELTGSSSTYEYIYSEIIMYNVFH